MPTVEQNGQFLLLQQISSDFCREDKSFRCCSAPGSLQNFAPNVADQEIMEDHMDHMYDEEDAAFHAEAEAFARKRDAHELAVRRLYQDLVEDDEVGASEEAMSAPPGSSLSSSTRKHSDDGAGGHNETNEAGKIERSMHDCMNAAESKVMATSNKNGAELKNNDSQDGKKRHQASKGLRGNLNGRKHHQTSQKHVQPLKAVANEGSSSSSSLSNLAISPKSPPELKVSIKPAKTSIDLLSSRRTHEESNGNCIFENESSQRKAAELVRTRKPIAGFSRRRSLGEDNTAVLNEPHSATLSHENLDSGPYLLKLAKRAIACGDKPQKALDYAIRAAKAFESTANGKSSLELIMCSHVLAALHCSLAQYDEALVVLEKSLDLPMLKAGRRDYALAAFAGYMQLGDTLGLLGKSEESLAAYCTGLEVQIEALGENDPRVGETCRYLAEAHAQALQFDVAEELCQKALDLHKKHSAPASVEEATDRRLMSLIYNGKGLHEAALEQLVLASMALVTNGRDSEVAAVNASIGDTYVSLGRLDEAVIFYQKALKVLKASKGGSPVAVASLYVSLAQLYLKTGKLRESRAYCESVLRLYSKQSGSGHSLEEMAAGLTEIAIIYESLNECDLAFSFLQKAVAILEMVPGQQSAVAGVEAQIGVFHYLHGDYGDARDYFGKAVSKLRKSAEKNTPLFGVVLNQMGLACIQVSDVHSAVTMFEESRTILEAVCGLHHPDTLSVYSNLAGAYDALGRLDDAIAVLQHTLEARAVMQGLADMEVEDERARLAELLEEAARVKARRCHSIEDSSFHSNLQLLSQCEFETVADFPRH